MNNIYSSPNTYNDDNLRCTNFKDICKMISHSTISAEKLSKETYRRKAELIKDATDMSTPEKLDAMDKNNEYRCREIFQNELVFNAVPLGITIITKVIDCLLYNKLGK